VCLGSTFVHPHGQRSSVSPAEEKSTSVDVARHTTFAAGQRIRIMAEVQSGGAEEQAKQLTRTAEGEEEHSPHEDGGLLVVAMGAAPRSCR